MTEDQKELYALCYEWLRSCAPHRSDRSAVVINWPSYRNGKLIDGNRMLYGADLDRAICAIIKPVVQTKLDFRRNKESDVPRLAKENERLRAALQKVTEWELPATGKFWDEEETRPVSYESEYGSKGVKQYMQNLARKALEGNDD